MEYIMISDKKIRLKWINRNDHTPTIVFLHDALGSIEQWKDFPLKLCDAIGYSGLIYDRVGHGGSEGHKRSPLPIDFLNQEAKGLRAILKNFNISNPILLGSSDGGSIALIYACQHSAKAIITIGAHYYNEEATYKGVEAMKQDGNKHKIVQGLTKYHGEKAADLVEAWQEVWTSNRYKKWSIAPLLSDISIPTLILQGNNDEYATDNHATSMANKIGENAISKIIKGGHFPHLQYKETTIKIIQSFLASDRDGQL